MTVVKKLLLTSLSEQGNRKTHNYFSYMTGSGYRYCDGLSVAEAGTKYMLSQVDIDEIIVLGGADVCRSGEAYNRMELRDYSDYDAADTSDLSEYGFFQYRIAQFLDRLDVESIDVLERIDPERRQEILKKYQEYCNYLSQNCNYRPDMVFHLVAQDNSLFDKLKEMIPSLTSEEFLWLERYIYTQLSDNMKLTVREDNADIRVCFIPTGKGNSERYAAAENVVQIVHSINELEADVIELYMDMQGLDSSEGYTILAVLSMLSNDANNLIQIKEIITSRIRPGQFAGVIDNKEMKRYDINNLVSGMNAFIRYGKVDEVQAYWDGRNIQNEHVDMLLYAMRRVDEGLSLCNISDLVSGIKLLKRVFNETPMEELAEVESNIFRILEDTIRMDYGKLLEGDDLDELELVKWGMKKKFYQQCLTIIESRLPTDMMNRGLFYYAINAETKQAALEEMNKLYWSYLPKDRWTFNDLPHFFIKYYGKNQMKRNPASKDRQKDFTEYRIRELDGEAEGVIKAYSILNENRKELSDLLYAYYVLGDVRNKINHAEAKSSEGETIDIHAVSENIRLLKEGVDLFVKTFEAARAKANEVHLESVETWQIAPEELKEYTATHRIFDKKPGGRPNNRPPRPNDNRNGQADQKKPAEGSDVANRPAEHHDSTPKPAEGSDVANKPAEHHNSASKPAEPHENRAIPARVNSEVIKTAVNSGAKRITITVDIDV